ncbi:MAG: biotin/lipoate A/B protein ligase family protein [Candidatus Brocadiia bacterium]
MPTLRHAPWTIHELSFEADGPFSDLAFEEAMYTFGEQCGTTGFLRLWYPSSVYVVLGVGQKVAQDVRLAECQKDGVTILRRFSGGGTVLHSPGQVCFSLYLPYFFDENLRDVRHSYDIIFRKLEPAFAAAGIALEFHEPCDFAAKGMKISGNAQRRGRSGLLHHGTLLVNCNTDAFARYLNEPDKRPEYRKERTHGQFVTTLARLGFTGNPMDAGVLLRNAISPLAIDVPQDVIGLTERLKDAKYTRPEWNLRR